MDFLKKIRSTTATGATVFLVIGILLFFLPGLLSLMLGKEGAVFGIIAVLGSMIFIVPSIKAITGKSGEQQFLLEADRIGARDSVLAAIDGTPPLDGVSGCDVRIHPSFIAIRTGNVAHAWRADSIAWVHRQDKTIDSKSKVYGVTILKQTELQYSVELWNLERKSISIRTPDENGANRLMNILQQVYPNAVYGYSESLKAAYDRDPQSFWRH